MSYYVCKVYTVGLQGKALQGQEVRGGGLWTETCLAFAFQVDLLRNKLSPL